jgi:hypothetical protein
MRRQEKKEGRKPNKGGRPPVVIEPRQVHTMASYGCTVAEIAAVMECSAEDRLRIEARTRGEFDRVQVIENASQSGDVPDEREVRLVIIGPEAPHMKGSTSSAMTVAQTVLEQRGNSPRSYKSALVFLAAESKALDSLEQAVRTWLAWNSIDAEKDTMDSLSMFQRKQIEAKLKDSDSAVHARIPETYTWLLVPEQQFDEKERKVGPLTWREARVTGSDHLSIRASKKMVNDGMLIATHWSPVLLRMELDRIPLWRGDHVSVKQLADDFSTYVYLPRLRNPDVLLNAISEGASALLWEKDTFAYADVYDEATKRYGGLIAGGAPPSIDLTGIVIRSEVARAQITDDNRATPSGVADATSPAQPLTLGGELSVPPLEPRIPTRFWANLEVDALRMPREAGQIAEAVVAHLNGLVGAKVRISVEIEAKVPDGIPETVQRTVSENCRTLKIGNFGFEES